MLHILGDAGVNDEVVSVDSYRSSASARSANGWKTITNWTATLNITKVGKLVRSALSNGS